MPTVSRSKTPFQTISQYLIHLHTILSSCLHLASCSFTSSSPGKKTCQGRKETKGTKKIHAFRLCWPRCLLSLSKGSVLRSSNGSVQPKSLGDFIMKGCKEDMMENKAPCEMPLASTNLNSVQTHTIVHTSVSMLY